MKVRLLPILVSLIISAVILFGGLFAYRSFAMENPLNKVIEQIPGVTETQIHLTNQSVVVKVKLSKEANLRDLYQQVNAKGSNIIGNRILDIQVMNASSKELDDWWSTTLFDIAQAMETKHYSDIPQVLKLKSAAVEGLEVSTEMDTKNVYIRLMKGDHSKYIVLPHDASQIGVWQQ